MQGLTVGRIVHVRLPHGIRPAIVTSVHDKDGGIIGAQIFNDPSDPPGDPINPKTGDVYRQLGYSKDDGLGTWFWPPRA